MLIVKSHGNVWKPPAGLKLTRPVIWCHVHVKTDLTHTHKHTKMKL